MAIDIKVIPTLHGDEAIRFINNADDVLVNRMKEIGMEQETLQWYLDLRRFGGCKHSGFGLGFDRMLMYLSGVANIRDVQPYPRTPRNLIF